MGLMTAFLLRGAGLTLATQWSVDDGCAAVMVLTYVEEMQGGSNPTDALRAAQKRAREMSTEEILGTYEKAKKLFPDPNSPERAKLDAYRAWICHRAGLHEEARASAQAALAPLRSLGLQEEVEALEPLLRGEGETEGGPQVNCFDSPVFWGAFHFVGRVV